MSYLSRSPSRIQAFEVLSSPSEQWAAVEDESRRIRAGDDSDRSQQHRSTQRHIPGSAAELNLSWDAHDRLPVSRRLNDGPSNRAPARGLLTALHAERVHPTALAKPNWLHGRASGRGRSHGLQVISLTPEDRILLTRAMNPAGWRKRIQ